MKSGKKINNEERIEKAWGKLCYKIESEGLLPGNDGQHYNSVTHSGYYKLAGASVAILAAASLLIFLLIPQSATNSIQNRESDAISVTTLADGTTVYIAGESGISYHNDYNTDSRKITLSGEAFFEVTPNSNSPFTVQARGFTITVVGTSFSVDNVSGRESVVVVESGKIQVRLDKSGDELFLEAGESVSVSSGKFTPYNKEGRVDFLNTTPKLHFKDQKIDDVVRVINKRYTGTKSIKVSKEAAGRTLTATFSGESPDTMAAMICKALGLQYTIENETITIHE
jgi:ferric-dicitrate binding protein FerR (iron transport regulator)